MRVLLIPDLPIERWPSMDRYASRLVSHLPAQAPDLAFEIAGRIAPLPTDLGRPREPHPSGIVTEALRYAKRYGSYPRRVRRRPADVVHVLDHSYAHLVRHARGRPVVVTVHDLLPALTVRRPAVRLRHRVRNALLERVLAALRDATAWIVATEWMRDEFGDWLGKREGIHVIPFGVDDAFFEPLGDSREALRERLGLDPGRFVILHVGSVVERKNIPALFAALEGLRVRGIDATLLQVGGTFTETQRIDMLGHRVADYVRQRAEVSERDLCTAYQAADVLLFPSHYEGFGLPIVEAMASGLPVITSGAAATAEVAGDAAVVVHGRDPERYADALQRVASDTAWADSLRRRGRDRARQFRWAETARRTAEVYRTLG